MPAPFFENYTRLVPEADWVATLTQQLETDLARLSSITEVQGNTIHPPYTWSLKEVLGHMIDTEIVFAYRAFRFSRGDGTPLAGFDENDYVTQSCYPQRTVQQLVKHLTSVRLATIELFASIPPSAWQNQGTASGLTWRVEDLGRAIIGHVRHHQAIIDKRLS